MYMVKIKTNKSTCVSLCSQPLPFTYNRNGHKFTIHEITADPVTGQFVIMLQCDDGEIQTFDTQYHRHCTTNGISCHNETADGAWVISANVDINVDVWYPAWKIAYTGMPFVHDNESYTIIGGDIHDLLLLKNGDITHPIVVRTIDEANQYGIVWTNNNDVLMSFKDGSNGRGMIVDNTTILLNDGTTRNFSDLQKKPHQYYFVGRR